MKELIKQILREDLIKRPMLLKENCEISESLRHHLTNKLTLSENLYRPFSDSYFELINEVRELYSMDMIELNEDDEWFINTDIGKTAYYKGDIVWLDIPFRDGNFLSEAEYRGRKVNLNSPFRTPGGPKKFSVYVKNKSGNVIKVSFGDPNLREIRSWIEKQVMWIYDSIKWQLTKITSFLFVTKLQHLLLKLYQVLKT